METKITIKNKDLRILSFFSMTDYVIMIFSSPKNCYDEMWQLNFLSDATKPV
jgi:hypothetical protein